MALDQLNPAEHERVLLHALRMIEVRMLYAEEIAYPARTRFISMPQRPPAA